MTTDKAISRCTLMTTLRAFVSSEGFLLEILGDLEGNRAIPRQTRTMPKLPECSHCQFYARSAYTVCAVHPSGVDGDSCLDFRLDPKAEPEELWEPEGASRCISFKKISPHPAFSPFTVCRF